MSSSMINGTIFADNGKNQLFIIHQRSDFIINYSLKNPVLMNDTKEKSCRKYDRIFLLVAEEGFEPTTFGL